MISKDQADKIKRLVRDCWFEDVVEYVDSLTGKDEPYLYVYEWDTPFGQHKSISPRNYNGSAPHRTISLYRSPQPAPPSIPAGWRLAPEEITEDMARELWRDVKNRTAVQVWEDMLAAAPQPPAWSRKQRIRELEQERDALLAEDRQPPTPPHECKTDDEKRAYCFGWFKALETVQQRKPMTENDVLALFNLRRGAHTVGGFVRLVRKVERFHKIGDEA
jgi:hypothetical protein